MAVLLIAEDHKDIRHVHEKLFAGRGYTVLTAGDGASALEEANKQHPDVVVADLVMPKVDGLQLCRAIRMHPRLRKIPVIMLSGSLRSGDPRTRTAQVCSVLAQPVTGEDLIEAVEFQLDRGSHGHGVLGNIC